MTSTNQGQHPRPTIDDEPPGFIGGDLEGADAAPGRVLAWSQYRDEHGRPVLVGAGHRELQRWLRAEPHRDLYVLQRSTRTGHWSYVALSFLAAHLAANRLTAV